MDNQTIISVIEIAAGLIVIPYLIWTVTSIFSMRQEIALLKLEIEQNKEIHLLLKQIIEKLDR